MHLLDRVDAGEVDLAVIIRPPVALQGWSGCTACGTPSASGCEMPA